jgi:hypothetical protein
MFDFVLSGTAVLSFTEKNRAQRSGICPIRLRCMVQRNRMQTATRELGLGGRLPFTRLPVSADAEHSPLQFADEVGSTGVMEAATSASMTVTVRLYAPHILDVFGQARQPCWAWMRSLTAVCSAAVASSARGAYASPPPSAQEAWVS